MFRSAQFSKKPELRFGFLGLKTRSPVGLSAARQQVPGNLDFRDIGSSRLLFDGGHKMARAAVGLFENSQSIHGVIQDLEASGFPRSDIRILSEPRDMAGSGMMSIPHTDFEVDLVRELRTVGAAEADAEAYVKGVRGGGVLVFASGSDEKVDVAAEIMNRHCAVELEELGASEPHSHSPTTPGRNSSGQIGRIRSSGGGARLFVW
jgi:hypothetical protein